MTLSSIFLILRKQVIAKWGRFILSAGGIVVGVWALTLTTGLSLGLSDTIITAINSQTIAREAQIYREESGAISFFDLQGPPTFNILSFDEVAEVAASDDRIDSISISNIMQLYLPGPEFSDDCTPDPIPPEQLVGLSRSGIAQLQEDNLKCNSTSVLSDSFTRFYENNKTNWVGDTSEPGINEVVMCFSCGNIEFNELYGASEPEDLIGKEIVYQYDQAPNFFNVNDVFEVVDQGGRDLTVPGQETFTLTIKAVVDDRGSNAFGGLTPIYMDISRFTDAYALIEPGFTSDQYGGVEFNVFLKDFEDLDDVISSLQDEGFLTFSLGQSTIQAVEIAFVGLNIFLAGFGVIALIASVFGIIAVMTISVLERKKEIGILKSMGAKSRSIFTLFILESTFIGIIGWIIGTTVAVACGYVISAVVEHTLTANETWAENLEIFNINDFSPDFPLWLFVSTLLIALVFTVLSGLFPALNAAKQNPVDVLRGE